MTGQPRPYPASLSRLLSAKFTRSRSIKTRIKDMPMMSAGYVVRDLGHKDHIVVWWQPGERYRTSPSRLRLAVEQEELVKIQSFLEGWNYPVKRSGYAVDPEYWNWLNVFSKKEKNR